MKPNRIKTAVIFTLFFVHIFADFLLLGFPEKFFAIAIYFRLTLPFIQTGLLVAWTMILPLKSELRFPIAIGSILWAWFMTSGFIDGYHPQILEASTLFHVRLLSGFVVLFYLVHLDAPSKSPNKIDGPSSNNLFLQGCFGISFIWLNIFSQLSDSGQPIFFSFRFVLPISQAGLISIWAAKSRWKSYIRIPVALLGTMWTWFVFIQASKSTDPHFTLSEAIMFITQLAVIVVGSFFSSELNPTTWRSEKTDELPTSPRLQFSIGFLLIWMSVFALILGLGKMLWIKMNWSPAVVQYQYFYWAFIAGTFAALRSLAALAAAIRWKMTYLCVVIALICVVILAFAEDYLFVSTGTWKQIMIGNCIPAADEIIFGRIYNGFSTGTWKQTMVDGCIPAFYLFATLLPLRWCGLLGEMKKMDLFLHQSRHSRIPKHR
jgi:hypothetical protein